MKIFIYPWGFTASMKRKIVQHGSSSLTLTLPSTWAQRFHLAKGDELSVQESGPMLIISTEQQMASPRKSVETTQFGAFTKNNLSHLYQLGYDELDISFDTLKGHETVQAIMKRIPDCIGFEIIDQRPGHITIKSIASTLESEYDMLLRKSFLITDEMAKGIMEAVRTHSAATLPETRTLEALNNKFTNTCLRILNKRGYKVVNRGMQMYETVKMIERIADELRDLCDALIGMRQKVNSALASSIIDALKYYLTFSEMFFKFSPGLKQRIYEGKETLTASLSSQLEKASGKQSAVLHHLLNVVQKTSDAAGGYFALML